jgi:hypothetical protein
MKKSTALSLAGLIFLIGGFISFLLKANTAALILSFAGIAIYIFKKLKKEI